MAKATFVQDGESIDVTAGTAIAQGDVVVLAGTNGKIVGVAARDIAAGATGAVLTRGVFTIPKVSADVFVVGEKVFWHITNFQGQISATGSVLLGSCAEPAGNGALFMKVLIPFQGL
ncbi:MAG: DUF2190 family protein [Pseudolabrys sp.]|nr:DUF2190 family protein [Pseudolabrys sp.]